MNSYSRPNTYKSLHKTINEGVQSQTGMNFHPKEGNITTITQQYDSKPIKDISYLKDILDYSKDLFTVYNKGNRLPLINQKLKEIKNTSYDGLYNYSLITLSKGINKVGDKKNEQRRMRNHTDNISLFQTNSSLNYFDQNKLTISALNDYYNQISTYANLSKNKSNYDVKSMYTNINPNHVNKITKKLKAHLKELNSNENIKAQERDRIIIPHIHSKSKIERNKNKEKTDSISSVTVDDKHQFKLGIKSNLYHIPFSHRKQKSDLKRQVDILFINKDKNIQTEVNRLQLTNLNKEMIAKILFINKYLNKIPKNQFFSNRPRYRKIFTILDGTVAFSNNYIKGHFIEIPSLRYLSFLDTKRERMKLKNQFIASCMVEFKLHIPIKGIFLVNGTFIDDLSYIAETEKAVYITTGVIFQGLHILSKHTKEIKRLTTESDLNLLETKREKIPDGTKPFGVGVMFKKKKKVNIKRRVFKIKRNKCEYLLDQSFTYGLTSASDTEEYLYYSDNEKKKANAQKIIKSQYTNHIDHVLALTKAQVNLKIKDIKNKQKAKLDKYYRKHPKEKTIEGIVTLVDIYNKIRAKKYKINVLHQLNHDRILQKQLDEKAKKMMLLFFRKLKILQNYTDNSAVFDSIAFYGNKEVKPDKIYKNIKYTYNLLKDSTVKIQKYYPDLISFNIPKILKSFPKLKRREFYDVFIQFKTLLNICTNINKNIKAIEKGIDFNTFFNCNPQMKFQGIQLAKKMYKEMNTLNEKYLNWEHYMLGMLTMKNKDINDKIDLFLGIIDSDKNGALSYAEVLDLSIASLGRAFNIISNKDDEDNNKDKDEVILILAEFFAQFIFSLVDRPITEEIPIGNIKKKILEKGIATSHLEMFICADNFT